MKRRNTHRLPCRAIVLLFVCAILFSARGDAVTVAGCGECTLYAKKVWCPSSMTCYPETNCTCDVPCMDFRDCFFTEPTCAGCVSTSGVFCYRPKAKSIAAFNPCFSPDEIIALPALTQDDDTAEASASTEKEKKGDLKQKFPTCEEHCTGEGARCVSVLADCPTESVDRISLLAATAAIAVSLVLAILSITYVLRRAFSFAGRAPSPGSEKKTV